MSSSSEGDEPPPPPLPQRGPFCPQTPPARPPRPPPNIKFTKEDVNLLRYFALLRVHGPAASVFARAYTELSLVGSEGVVDFCRNTLGFSGERVRNLFWREQLQELRGSWDPFAKDITYLYKLLQVVCGLAPPSDGAWLEPSHRLEFLLRAVKEKRNALAHQTTVITDEELAAWSGSLLEDLRAILAHVAAQKGRDLQQDLQRLEDDVYRILRSQLPPVPCEELERDRADARRANEEHRQAFLEQTCAELRTRYADFCVVPQLLWESSGRAPVEQVFVAPEVSGEDEAAVPLAGLVPPHQATRRQVTVLQGSAGAGKTTLCRFLVNLWSRDPAALRCLEDVDVLLLVRCGAVHSDSMALFLAEELLPETLGDVPRADALPRLRGVRVLLVADGWDEAGAAGRALLHHALATLPALRVLITLRPEFALDLQLDLELDGPVCAWRWLHLQGWGAAAREEYLRKTLQGGDNGPEALLRFLSCEEHLVLEMQRLPMTLSLLVQLWRDDCSEVRGAVTRLRLFELLLAAKMQRLVQRHVQRRAGSSHVVRAGVQRWVQRLDAAAWVALQDGSCGLKEESAVALSAVSAREGLEEVTLLSALVGGYDGRANAWFFEHSLMQQFLAARFLAREAAARGGLLQGRRDSEARRLLPTVSFATAILCAEGRMDERSAAEVAALLGAPGVPWEAVGDALLNARVNPVLCAATAQLLADAPAVDRFSVSRSPALLTVLRHTALKVSEAPHVHVCAVSPELVEALALVTERKSPAVCAFDANTDLEAFWRALSEAPGGPPTFALAPTIKLRLCSAARIEALLSCLRAAQRFPRVALFLEAEDEDELGHICAFVHTPDALSLCTPIVNIPEEPWREGGIAPCVVPLLEACVWSGSMQIWVPFASLGELQAELRDLRLRREDLGNLWADFIPKYHTDEGEYENVVSWTTLPDEKIQLSNCEVVYVRLKLGEEEEEEEEEEKERKNPAKKRRKFSIWRFLRRGFRKKK